MRRKQLWVLTSAVGAALIAVALLTATAGAGTGRQFFYQSAKRPIPDAPNGGGVIDKLFLRGSARIADMNIGVRINHSADADLNIYLVSPKGKFVELSTDNGGGGNDYGDGRNDCRGARYAVFNDEAGRSIRQGSAPFVSGHFRPQTPLSALDGDRIGGTWRLMVLDDDARDTGTIGCFAMGVVLR